MSTLRPTASRSALCTTLARTTAGACAAAAARRRLLCVRRLKTQGVGHFEDWINLIQDDWEAWLYRAV